MRLAIYKNPDLKQDYIWYIWIKKEYTSLWYNEMMRRFKNHENNVYDVDESYECWVMSISHINEMFKFLNKKP